MRLRSERIVCPGRTIAGEVIVADGRISSVRPARDVDAATADGAELVELGDRWLLPGYIDVHVHGGGGAQCNASTSEEIAEVARFHARHGTTGLLATTVAAPLDDLCTALAAIADCAAPNLLGAHLEGPFLNRERPGAMDSSVFLDPDVRRLEHLLGAGAGRIRLMTLAPELPGGLELVERLVRAGVVASIGHTNAGDADVREAVRLGATAATHVFNAMPPLHHRRPSTVGAVLDLAEVSCELICDGVHVDPVAMRLAYRAKGAHGIRLVTDAIAAAGMPDGEYRLGGRAVVVNAGRALLSGSESIAGSTLTMEAAVQNAVSVLGVQIGEAVLVSSTNSARLLGLERSKGSIAAGLDADLVVLNEQLAVEATMVAGRWLTAPA
jgi:N-acetylglucosamine-6-phosphate deacetylase